MARKVQKVAINTLLQYVMRLLQSNSLVAGLSFGCFFCSNIKSHMAIVHRKTRALRSFPLASARDFLRLGLDLNAGLVRKSPLIIMFPAEDKTIFSVSI